MITIATAPAWDSGVDTAAAEKSTADESASVTLGSRCEHDDVNGIAYLITTIIETNSTAPIITQLTTTCTCVFECILVFMHDVGSISPETHDYLGKTCRRTHERGTSASRSTGRRRPPNPNSTVMGRSPPRPTVFCTSRHTTSPSRNCRVLNTPALRLRPRLSSLLRLLALLRL